MQTAVQQIKDRLAIEEVVSWYVELHPAGRHMKGKTPFGSERTPSFFVSPDKGLFYCFSTGKGGDIFSFIQEVEGIDFSAALKMLAQRAGVTLEPENPERRKRSASVKEAMTLANRWYQVKLRKHAPAVDYLIGRGLIKETIVKFEIGWAPAGNQLMSFLAGKGLSARIQEDAGLVSTSDRGPYDRFRDRVMFPLWSPQGQVVGFTGRIFLPEDPESAAKYAKYMNSPENELFHKSEVLYGYHLARKAIMTAKQVVLVEGQFDVILSHQAGIENCVGISGTALSQYQINLLKRFANEVIVVLDNDKAGVAAADKTAKLAFEAGLSVRAAKLPEGQDPADLISESPEAWKEAIESARPYINHRLSLSDVATGDTSTVIDNVRRIIFPLLAALPSAMHRDVAFETVSRTLDLRESAVRSDYESYERDAGDSQPRGAVMVPTQSVVANSIPNPEALLLGVYWSDLTAEGGESAEAVINKEISERDLSDIWKGWEDNHASERETLVFRAELMFGAKPERLAKELYRLLDIAHLQALQEKFDTILQTLKAQERQQADVDTSELQTEAQTVGRTIETIRSRLLTS